jgi:hypothetical protein
MKHTREALVATALSLLAACATVRAPVSEIAAAELAVRDAELAGAASYASLDLQQARYKLVDAKRAVEENDNLRARNLAEESQVDARVAETKAQLGKANDTVDQMRFRAANPARSTAGSF